jgi:hypothetical protein
MVVDLRVIEQCWTQPTRHGGKGKGACHRREIRAAPGTNSRRPGHAYNRGDQAKPQGPHAKAVGSPQGWIDRSGRFCPWRWSPHVHRGRGAPPKLALGRGRGLMSSSYGRPRAWVGMCPAISSGSGAGIAIWPRITAAQAESARLHSAGSSPEREEAGDQSDRWTPRVGQQGTLAISAAHVVRSGPAAHSAEWPRVRAWESRAELAPRAQVSFPTSFLFPL